MKKLILLYAVILFTIGSLQAQVVRNLFEQRSSLKRDFHKIASKYEALRIDKSMLTSLRSTSAETMDLELPFENKLLKLNLHKASITTSDFSVLESVPGGGSRKVSYSGAVFYQGTIEGKTKSIATISILNDQVMGIISDEKSNIILGPIEDKGAATDEYTLYRDNDLQIPDPFSCATQDQPVDGELLTPPSLPIAHRGEAVGQPIEIYFECDNKFYQDKGSSTNNVINYVLGFFNNTALIYANENVKIQVSQILVWTTQDPEAAAGLNTTSDVLTSFSGRMATATYKGDFAHFLSTRSLGGGVAYILSNPCASAKQFHTGVSAVNNSYSNFPTYSWTVEVVTHELGHNLGSQHTHWCGWVGGAIDNCYTTEGGCAAGPAPTNGGTIMSYCHLTSAGINLANGFGQQPGDKIRAVVAAATCYGNCKMTIDIAKLDASCGQNNGSATVTPTNGTGTVTYLWSNGQTGATLNNAGPGTYNVTATDGAACPVMGLVTLVNSGATLNAVLTPATATSFCTGGNVLLSVTNNVSYTYQWSKDGTPISGAVTSTYTATVAGNYSVNVVSGGCSVIKSVTITEVATPSAAIVAAGPTTFCAGSNVLLNGDAGSGYTYQWYSGGTAIPGAINPTYTATAAASYTVKVSAGSCQSTSAAVVTTVNPAPPASITAGGATSFCSGGTVSLTANTGSGLSYQWYLNANPISAAVSSSLVANTTGSYTVRVTKSGCPATSNAIGVTVNTVPAATITPAGPTAFCIEDHVNLNANTGSGYTYQWYKNGTAISGEVSAVYQALLSGDYSVKVINGTCSATSSSVTVTVSPGPTASIAAAGPASFCQGGNVNLQANSGTGYLYHWYRNGSAISGATNINYQATTAGSYTVVIDLGTCSSTSSAIPVTVLASPAITINPSNSTIEKFETQILTASGATTYNWSTLPGYVSGTGNNATFAPAGTTDYTIEGTDNNGCKGTGTATIHVVGCGKASDLNAKANSPARVLITWTNPPGVTSDSLNYRKAGSTQWQSVFASGQQVELNGLEPNTLYEYNLVPLCSSTDSFLPSANKSFTTLKLNTGIYLNLFPNPASNTPAKLEIIMDKPFSVSAVLYSNSGQKGRTIIPSGNYPAGQLIRTIDPSGLGTGIYNVFVTIDGKRYNLKLVIVR